MASPIARLDGYTETLVALRALPKAQQAAIRAEFRAVGQLVADAATKLMAELKPSPAERVEFRPYVRLRGLEVDEVRRKTTGLRPDFGGVQMRRGLIPAGIAETDEIVAGMDEALSRAQDAVGL